MERIFGEDSSYSPESLDQLKQVMLLSKQGATEPSIYGENRSGGRRTALWSMRGLQVLRIVGKKESSSVCIWRKFWSKRIQREGKRDRCRNHF